MRCEFIDKYDHVNPAFEYILENEVYAYDGTESQAKLIETFNLFLQNECSCSSECLPRSCRHGTNYIIKDQIKILNINRPCLDVIYECGSLCTCNLDCINRLAQFGPNEHLKIVQFCKGFEQFGLISLETLVEGCFICEYAGELLTKDEAVRRSTENDETNRMNYIMCLNENSTDGRNRIQTFIDPSRKGNIGRYLNHSCNPNCVTISIRIDSVLPKLGIFAKRKINSGEELTFDYGGGNDDKTIEIDQIRKFCFCNSENCRKFLPNNKF